MSNSLRLVWPSATSEKGTASKKGTASTLWGAKCSVAANKRKLTTCSVYGEALWHPHLHGYHVSLGHPGEWQVELVEDQCGSWLLCRQNNNTCNHFNWREEGNMYFLYVQIPLSNSSK